MPLDGLGYPLGPVVVIAVALALLALFMRWAFGSGRDRAPRRTPVDDGLLTRIATLSHRESALALRAALSDAGIRSTIREAGPGRTVLLVFPEDADRARALAASFPGRD